MTLTNDVGRVEKRSGLPTVLPSLERPRRLARPRTPPFHGDNTGSNPVRDAKQIKNMGVPLLISWFCGDSVVTK